MGLDKRNFIVYAHWRGLFQSLPDDRHRARLFDAMCGYALDGELPDFADHGATAILLESYFALIRQQIDIDSDHYKARCELNRANGQKGGYAKAASQAFASEGYQSPDSGSNGKQSVANLADIDIEHDTDPDKEPGKDSGFSRIVGNNLQADSSSHTLDYGIVTGQIETAYKKLTGQGEELLSFEDTVSVFSMFYDEYLLRTGEPHPRLTQDKIEKAIKALPFYETGDGTIEPIDTDGYERIIPAYFDNNFKNCNYSILHFLSGKNRNNRFEWQEG